MAVRSPRRVGLSLSRSGGEAVGRGEDVVALSSSDLIQVLIGLVATAAGIGSALRSLRKLRLSNGLVLIIGLILLVASAVIVVTFPFVNTVIYLAGGAGAIGFVIGGVAWGSTSRDVTVSALTVMCFVVVGSAFVWRVTNAQAQSAPVPLPGIASATATATPLIVISTATTATAAATRTPTKTTSSKTSSGGSSPSGSAGSSGGTGGSGTTGGVSATPTPTSQPVVPTPTAMPSPTPIPVAVNGANAAITSTTPNGCYPEVQVSGTITTNGGQGTVDYYWGRSDGSSSPPQSVGAVTGKTSYGVSDDWYPYVGGSSSTYWDELFVTSPGSAHSPQASETLSC